MWELLPKCPVSMLICNYYLWVQTYSWHASGRMQRLTRWFLCVFEEIDRFISLLSLILEDKCKKFTNKSCDECVKQDGVRQFLINKFMKWIKPQYTNLLNTKWIHFKSYWVCLLTMVGTVVHHSSCLPVMWSGFKSWHQCDFWIGFVVGSYFGFPISSILNSNSIRNACT